MSIRLLLATSNKGKQREFAALFSPNGSSEDDISCELALPRAEVPETGATFAENARIKARVCYEENILSTTELSNKVHTSSDVVLFVAEDSGIAVDGLSGWPGVYSARLWALEFNKTSSGILSCSINEHLEPPSEIDSFNLSRLVELTKNFSNDERRAYYVSHISVFNTKGEECISVEGRARGTICKEPRGTGGFGYDPIFVGEEPDGVRTWGEIPGEAKNRVSHRAKALAMLKIELLKNLAKSEIPSLS